MLLIVRLSKMTPLVKYGIAKNRIVNVWWTDDPGQRSAVRNDRWFGDDDHHDLATPAGSPHSWVIDAGFRPPLNSHCKREIPNRSAVEKTIGADEIVLLPTWQSRVLSSDTKGVPGLSFVVEAKGSLRLDRVNICHQSEPCNNATKYDQFRRCGTNL